MARNAENALGQLAAEIHILCDREIGRKKDFLMNQDDAAPLRVDRSSQRHGLTVDPQFAARRLQMTGEQLHESRLAGTVLADDGVNLPGINRQADILQHLDRDGGAAVIFIRPWSIRFRPSKTLPQLR